MKHSLIRYFGILFLSGLSLSLNAEETLIHHSWKMRTGTQGAKKSFYITSVPLSQTGSFKKRGQPYISIVSRPEQKSFNVFSLTAGYPYKEGSFVKISIFTGDKKKLKDFELFTQNERAWAEDEKMDEALIQAMKQGEILVAEGISQKGTISMDTYSLKGFTSALKELNTLSKKS